MAIKKMKYCPKCGFEIEQSMFYQSKNPHHDGFLPYCKDHCNSLYKEYKDKTNDTAKALFYTCALFDVPFVLEVFKKFNENKDRKIKEHQEKLDTKGKKKYTVAQDVEYANGYLDFYWYWDCLNKTNCGANDWSTFYSGTDVDFKVVSNNIKDLEVKEAEKSKYILDWGLQDTIDDYKFLDDKYNEYTKDIEIEDVGQSDKYRDLCQDRLSIRKINENRYNGTENIDTIQKRIDRTMEILKINNFKDNKPKTAIEQSFFEKIRLIDKNNVEDIYEKPTKYFDHNKLNKYEKDMCLRPLGNMLVGHRDFGINLEDIEKYDLD